MSSVRFPGIIFESIDGYSLLIAWILCYYRPDTPPSYFLILSSIYQHDCHWTSEAGMKLVHETFLEVPSVWFITATRQPFETCIKLSVWGRWLNELLKIDAVWFLYGDRSCSLHTYKSCMKEPIYVNNCKTTTDRNSCGFCAKHNVGLWGLCAKYNVGLCGLYTKYNVLQICRLRPTR